MDMNFDDNNERPRDSFRREAEADEPKRVQPNISVSIAINPSDVLCGRGKLSFNHVGNKRFRDLVAAGVGGYNTASSRLEKATVVNAIVEEIRAAGGRFLRHDEEAGTWHALNYAQCREKVGHAIRDATSSIESRKKRRLQREAARKNVAGAISAKSPPPKSPSEYRDAGNPSLQGNAGSIVTHYGGISQFLAGQSLSGLLEEDERRRASPGYVARNLLKESDEDLQSDMLTATGVWRSNVSRARHTFAGKSGDHDDQFLAYIDDVLGPLPSDADKNQDMLITSTCSSTEEPTKPVHPANADMDEAAARLRNKVASPGAQAGRARLGSRFNARWFPNLGLNSEAKGMGGPSG